MKKRICAMFLAMSMLAANTVSLQAQTLIMDGKAVPYDAPVISLYVNQKKVETTQMAPININNRVLVPMREVFESMGATVNWNGSNKTVTVGYGKTVVVLGVDKKEAYVNGKLQLMDVPPKVINSKVMIPVRFVSEALGMSVYWDSKDHAVYISEVVKPEQAPSNPGQGNVGEIVQTNQSYNGGVNAHSLVVSKGDYAKTKITNVTLNEEGGKLIATLSASSAISDAQISLLPGKVIIDVKNSMSGLQSSIAPVSNTYVKNIRTSQFTSDTVRVVLDLRSGALVTASLSQDRTKLQIALSDQNLESLQLCTVSQKDYITIKGLSTQQVAIVKDEVNKKVTFTVDHMKLAQRIDWNKLNASFIERLVVTNSGNQMLGVATLKEWVNVHLEDSNDGVKLVFSKQSAGGNADNSVDNVENGNTGNTGGTNVQKGVFYTLGNKPTIQMNIGKSIPVAQLKITDDYRNRKLIFDLGKDYSSVLPDQTKTIGDSVVKSIVVTNKGTTKITVNTATIYNYYVYENPNGMQIQLVKPSEKYNKIVVLDIGHGGTDAGAVANNIKEKVVNFDQGMALFHLLEADPSIKVYMTRETDVYPTLQFRASLANEIGADLFVSIHNNSAAPNIVGTETLYYPSASDTRGKQIAQVIQKAIVSNCGMNDRGIKARPDLYVLKSTNMPAVLIETGFLTNANEAAKISSASFISTWSKAVYRAIVESFELL